MKKIRRKRQHENPINAKVAKTLGEIEGVAEILRGGVGEMQEIMESLQHDIRVLEQAVDMNFWVHIKMQNEGHFDPGSEARQDPQEMIQVAQDYQVEYLCCIAIAEFLEHMGQSEEEND